jgi:exosortase D (VPLPA-CTERM-specific)
MMSVQSIRLPEMGARRVALVGVAFSLALGIALLEFSGALLELVRRWRQQEEYSHGFLIPIVVLWLLWTRREALLSSVGRPSWAGPVLILLAMVMHLTGELSAIFVFSQVAFVVAIMGILLGLGGYSLFKVAFIPVAFLLFAIPLPYFIDANLSLQLQLISSQLGVFVIGLFDIPVYLEGNIIDLGYYKLQVVDACSGLRYLFPLLSLGFLAAYLFHAPRWQKAIVFLSTIPITIAMNGFRIGMVGVTVDRWGPKMADEVLHWFEGWLIFLACAALLAGEMLLLARASGRGFFETFYVPVPAAQKPQHPAIDSRPRAPIVASLALVCAIGLIVSSITHRAEIIPDRNHFVSFPGTLGQWQGHPSEMDADVQRGLGFDDYIFSDYSRPDGKAVNFYVAYYASQRKGESPHSPLVCIPGDGWLITDLRRLAYDGAGIDFPINRAIVQRDSAKEVVYYWYDERGRKIASEYWSKWYLLSDAILKNRTDGALVRLIAVVAPGELESDADARLQAFMQVLVPRLSEFLPSDSTSAVKSADNSPRAVQ